MPKAKNNHNTGVQLITYADSMGNNLQDLKIILDKYFKDYIKGVHILPFYPSSADRGFAPLSHRQIDLHLGTFDDLKSISKEYDLMADLIVNHVSKESRYFRDYLAKGDKSKYRNYFIKSKYFSRHWYKRPKSFLGRKVYDWTGRISTFLRRSDFLFHKHGVNRLTLKKIYRPRPGSPFVKFRRADSSKRYLWCTFSPDQIDLNITSAAVRRKFRRDIRHLESLGVRYLRLDAVAYAGKRRGTNNFLINETINFIKWLTRHAHKHDMKVIPEVHFDYQVQLKLAKIKNVDYVYDFALPFLMLHALLNKDAQYLKAWLKIRPRNSIANLDTHDGIGVVDVKGLLPKEEIERTSEMIYKNGGNAALRASGNNAHNVDVYQINCTYYSALAENDNAYLCARAIQLFLPGIPQIYYVGLLAGRNDSGLLEKTKNGRDVNRHYYKIDEIDKEINRGVVQKLLKICKLRNNHSAFKGSYRLILDSKEKVIIAWKNKKIILQLEVDFNKHSFLITENKNKILDN